jgi:glucose/arabinose dehydrogenase
MPCVAQEAPDGAALYKQYCAQCHGATMQGGNAQSMVDGVWQFGEGAGYMFRNTKHGITHLGMPAFEATLTDDQIKAIVDFVRNAERESGAVKPPPPDRIQTLDYEIDVTVVAEGLEIPWAIAFPDSSTALITERPGRVRVLRDGKLDPAPVSGTPQVLHEGQGGLMDVAIDPQFSENGWVYLAYSHALSNSQQGQGAAAMTRIVRGRINDNTWSGEEVVFEAPHDTYLTSRIHYGCQIAFDAEGHLFFGIGERGQQEHAQDLSRPNGKIHRVWPDGRIPDDNPFVAKEGALPSIYCFGNRNPQGLSINPADGLLWESEHGPMGGDEINVIEAGKNYGWPLITYGRNYNGAIISEETRKPGLQQPAMYYRPSIAVSGIEFYRGDQFPKWNNAMFVGALKYETVGVLHVEGGRVLHEETILRNIGRVRDIACDPEGAVYVVANSPDIVLRLTLIAERKY